ncbi:hypothetical protein NKJ59_30850 [Mesorhizobium australicum]|uniref:hypothetical protein n=1 Tax=Mesorhizobium australicum TaxID=536018 RepID=UPI003336769F
MRIKLRCCGQRFERGQRIRLAVATAALANSLPVPEKATLSIHRGSRLILPVRKPQPLDATLAAFEGPASTTAILEEVIKAREPFCARVRVSATMRALRDVWRMETHFVRVPVTKPSLIANKSKSFHAI